MFEHKSEPIISRTAFLRRFAAALALIVGLRPIAAAAADSWEFSTAVDLSRPSLIDLSHLNEAVAGEHGFVRRNGRGDGFVRGDGEPLRFWGVAPWYKPEAADDELLAHARFLARMGVNLVRPGGAESGLIPQQPGVPLDRADPTFVRKIWRLVAAMKRAGIYTRIAPFWDHGACKYIDPGWGLAGYASGDGLNGLLFFEPALQTAWRAWMRQLLCEVNPHTGIPLRDDPAVALIQVVSEDTLLFYWLDKIHGGPRRVLEERFAAWAVGRHGSCAAALAAWGGPLAGDQPDAGRLALLPMHRLTAADGGPRADDTARFLAETERRFYGEAIRYLRDELGCRLLVGGSNFHSASALRLDDLQRWCWSAGDLLELNEFFPCQHQGPHSDWRIQAGHTYRPTSFVRARQLPAAMKQVAGLPFINSSTNWLAPNPYGVEGPLVHAVYSSQNGLDGICWLASSSPTYNPGLHLSFATVQGSQAMLKWRVDDPCQMAQFPAAALIFRLNLVPEAAPAVVETRRLASLFARQPAAITDGLEHAPANGKPPGPGPAAEPAAAPAAGRNQDLHLLGPVQLAFGDEDRVAGAPDPSPGTAPADTPVASAHLLLDRGRGLLRIDAPAAQGVAGFLKEAGGSFETADCRFESGSRFATCIVVSMDRVPLATSRRVLIQCGNIARPTGWREETAADGLVTVVDTGRMPWRIANTDLRLRVANPRLDRLQVLDEHGALREERRITPNDPIVLPPNCLYAILTCGGEAR